MTTYIFTRRECVIKYNELDKPEVDTSCSVLLKEVIPVGKNPPRLSIEPRRSRSAMSASQNYLLVQSTHICHRWRSSLLQEQNANHASTLGADLAG